jgi:zinc transporter ZupT
MVVCPQELGDYMAMVSLGVSHRAALALNLLSALSAFVGAIIICAVKSTDEDTNSYLIAFSAVR